MQRIAMTIRIMLMVGVLIIHDKMMHKHAFYFYIKHFKYHFLFISLYMKHCSYDVGLVHITVFEEMQNVVIKKEYGL